MAIMIRKATLADTKEIAAMHINGWQETYRGILNRKTLRSLSMQNRKNFWSSQISAGMIVSVALEHGAIVGFSACGTCRHTEELYTIYVKESRRRQGIGTALFEQAQADLAAQKLMPLCLWVVDGNPAHYFYDALGAQKLYSAMANLGPAQVKQSLYWSALAEQGLGEWQPDIYPAQAVQVNMRHYAF